jgi:serine phosphatase RsbU (regulator of sigma subunit)/catechol 2,3-dioxygenase-like lactoylglutathione lyase family enzyme
MSNSGLPFGLDRLPVRLDQREPYVSLHFAMIFVRDQEESLRFYVQRLGFRVDVDFTFPSGGRWIEVAPPDGSASLALALAAPGSESEQLMGRDTNVYFITEDIHAKYKQWTERGVVFDSAPQTPAWGGVFARFRDLDGNSFGLAGFDELTRGIAAQRNVLARKLEADRRAALEMEIARDVQSRLFPQIHPNMDTLDYAGVCAQARQVGGDYFDFLNLGQGYLGLVLGDVSGKGIAAALLMANLQANLRSQCTGSLQQLEHLLCSVNRLFYENSAQSAFASLFFAKYDDQSRRLRYANCGHLPAIILRKDQTIERLDSTCMLLGLFAEWTCSIEECELHPGDTLALFTDGVIEANKDGEEFGEQRLIEALQRSDAEPRSMLASVLETVQQYNGKEQFDDATLIIAKCKE